MASVSEAPDIRLDSANLYREETFTDRHAGTVRKLIPILADGSEDPSRTTCWEGSATLMTPAGTLPLNFELDATIFSEALNDFPDKARLALERMMQELREMRREANSSIVIPGQSGANLGDSGKFKLP